MKHIRASMFPHHYDIIPDDFWRRWFKDDYASAWEAVEIPSVTIKDNKFYSYETEKNDVSAASGKELKEVLKKWYSRTDDRHYLTCQLPPPEGGGL